MATNFMDRPHRYTAGPAGRCLFCSHTQTWHATNRPRTPEEIAQEKLAQKLQDDAQNKADQNLMLTPVPTEADLIAEAGKEMKVQDQAAKIAGNALYDENDPMAQAGLGGHKPPAEMLDQEGEGQGKMTGGMAGGGMGDPAGSMSPDMMAGAGAGVAKSQGFSGNDADSGDAPLPGTVESSTAQAEASNRKQQRKVDKGPAAKKPPTPTPPAKASAPNPQDPNSSHAKTLPNEGPDPGGDPNYKPPLSDEPRNGMSDAQRQVHADSGEAMKDGTMPIRDDPAHSESDLTAAQKVWGKHPDPHAARDHVVDRAEKLDLSHKLHPALQEHAANRKAQRDQQRQPVGKFRYAVTKSTEDRYTFGPLYPANSMDAHNEFADPATIQHALWRYMERTDRKINLQHQRGVTAGRLVEAVSWPSPHTTNLSIPGVVAKSAPVTFPAGTAYVGVVWEPWAWNLVKRGNLRGLSMGGSANRVQADLDVPEAVAKRYFSRAQRKTAASSGAALPDGSFPIENKKDLRNAKSLQNKGRNPAAAKAHIARRAAALGLAKALIANGTFVKCSTGLPDSSMPQKLTPRKRRKKVMKYSPDQPRIPHGRPGGGRWFGIGPGGSSAKPRVGGTWDGITYRTSTVDLSPSTPSTPKSSKPKKFKVTSDTVWDAKSALMPEHTETQEPGRSPNITRIRSRAVEYRQRDKAPPGVMADSITELILSSIARGSGKAMRMSGPSNRAGIYVGKSFALTGEPPPFA